MIVGKNITKTYNDKEIFSKIDFIIGNYKKIGLVGKNGCGKTTLFKLIAGVEEPTEGNIEIQSETIAYIPQELSFPNQTVLSYLESKLPSKDEMYKIEMLATQLKFSNYNPSQNINTLSEGQKMKIKLIEAMLSDPTALLIDEPTNHLDIEGIMWFENYVKHLDITVVMISHDRSFLNHTVDEIWEIDKNKIFKFVGDYDNYKEEKLKLISKWDQEYVLFLKKKAQLETLLENVRKIKGGKQRGRAVGAVKKRIDREILSDVKEKYVSRKIKDIHFETQIHPGKMMIKFENVSKSYGKTKVFNGLDFEIRGKEKVWLFGPNGAGKTTITKLIMSQEKPNEGNIKIGENIKIGYFSQVQTHLDSNNNLLDEFMDKTSCFYGDAYGYLKKYMFDKDAVKKRIGQLSPGERARFAFCVFSYNNYDLLILDEPDNHLDIETKEVLEKSLGEYKGTLLLVSHDRYFVESVGINKLLNLKEGQLVAY